MKTSTAAGISAVLAIGMAWSAVTAQTVTITEDFSLTRPYHPGSGDWATVTGVDGIEWDMYCVSRATYNPPNPGDTNFANLFNAGYLMARFEDAVTRVSFKARSYSTSATAEFEVFLNNQSLGVHTVTGAVGQTVSIDIAEPGTHNVLKIQFLRWSAGQYARANIDDLAITFDTTIHTPARHGWGPVYWVHNAYGHDPKTERYICWATPLSDSSSVVQYGETPALGTSVSSDTGHVLMRDTTARMDPFYTHYVLLTGLAPGTTYHYRCGGDSGESTLMSFTTEVGAHTGPYTFAVSADVQGGYNTSTTFDALAQFLVARSDIDFWYQLGDLVQNGGHPGEWMAFFESGRSIFEKYPAMVIRGNHEEYDDNNYFYLRKLFPYLDNDDRRYEFSYANGAHISLDNSRSTEATPWFSDVLAANTREWLFVSWHANPYSTGGHGGDVLAALLSTYLPLVEQYGVTTVFNGHSHAFEVTHPLVHLTSPPTLDRATLTAPDYAVANRTQGTIFYNGAGVNSSTAILVKPSQEFTITGDTAGEYQTVTLATVYNDSVIYRETAYMDFGSYQTGDVVFTYKVVNDAPVAAVSQTQSIVDRCRWTYSSASRCLAVTNAATGSRIALLDLRGRVAAQWTATSASLRLDLGSLSPAAYLVTVGNGTSVLSSHVTVQ